MEKSSKRGKIPQQDWPSIIERYEAGETLASIARTYDCSPPAISYIVSRTRARSAAAEAAGQTAPASAPVAAEPQLLKGTIAEMPAEKNMPAGEKLHDGAGEPKILDFPPAEPRLIEQPASAQSRTSAAEPNNAGYSPRIRRRRRVRTRTRFRGRQWLRAAPRPRSVQRPARSRQWQCAAPGRSRRDAPAKRRIAANVASIAVARKWQRPACSRSLAAECPSHRQFRLRRPFSPRPPAGQPVADQRPRQGQASHYSSPGSAGVPVSANAAPNCPPGDGQHMKEGGAFIDRALRERVDGDIAAFLAAFDAALDHDTSESRTELREATDRLLRAGARTRIELERLEARAPLPPRDKIGQTAPLFRHR